MSHSIDPRPRVPSPPDPIEGRAISAAPPAPTTSFRPAQNAIDVRPRVMIEGSPNAIYGDRAGEYRTMTRGRYSAWLHVVFAFGMQVVAIGAVVGGGAAAVAGALVGHGDAAMIALLAVGGAAGIAGAYFTFRDRFRCIEAFSSRFCSGLANLSLLYVPAIAFIYANVRGIQKLAGK